MRWIAFVGALALVAFACWCARKNEERRQDEARALQLRAEAAEARARALEEQ